MIQKLFLCCSLIISLSSQIHSKSINAKCIINDNLLALIHQLEGYVRPLAENEVPVGMEFQLVEEFTKSELEKYSKSKIEHEGVQFVINGKPIEVDLKDNSQLSKRLELFLTEDRNDDSALLLLELTIDRIPIEECDGINHLTPPPAAGF